MSAPTKSLNKVLTEEDLRAFSYCPRYLSFGGSNVYPDSTALLKLTVEKAISDSIRKDRLDPGMKYMKSLLRSSKELQLDSRYMEGQVRELHSKVGIALGELFGAFDANSFLPVTGPIPWRVKVSDSVVQVTTSAVLQEKTTLHLIDFSPYRNIHGIKNDPIIYLKAQTVSQLAKTWFSESSECILHVFSLSEKEKLLYYKVPSTDISNAILSKVTNIVQGIELKLNFPILPCNRNCLYKTECFLENE